MSFWLLEHYPNARSRAANGELAFGTIDTWLLYRLTGGEVHATEPNLEIIDEHLAVIAPRWEKEKV